MLLRRARAEERDAINEHYASVDFKPSAADDLQLLAEAGKQLAGLGRIVAIDARHAELGGIVVLPPFRGQGLARQLIAALCAHNRHAVLYCLPFAELAPLYASVGFVELPDASGVVAPVAQKHLWCNAHYPKPVLLMRRSAP